MVLFPKPNHAHSECVDAAQKRFDEISKTADKRLGVHVRAVFEVLVSKHRAFTAYEIVDVIAERGRKLQATQVYRALDTLLEIGIIHRIESRNAYIACHGGEGCDQPQLMICRSCDRVAEINSNPIEDSIKKTAQSSGFVVQSRQVELLGLCPNCA